MMTLGAYLLSLIDASINSWVFAFYMFVFGVGHGPDHAGARGGGAERGVVQGSRRRHEQPPRSSA